MRRRQCAAEMVNWISLSAGLRAWNLGNTASSQGLSGRLGVWCPAGLVVVHLWKADSLTGERHDRGHAQVRVFFARGDCDNAAGMVLPG